MISGCIYSLFLQVLDTRMNKEHSVVNTNLKLTVDSRIVFGLCLIALDLLHQVEECIDSAYLLCALAFQYSMMFTGSVTCA